MYGFDRRGLAAGRIGRLDGIGRNVYFLGLTSLLADVSSEMVASMLPMYFVFALRLSPLEIGLVDGLYQGAATLTRLIGGVLADRWRRFKEIAVVGYGMSALTRLGMLMAGAHLGAISTSIAVDRFGKGLRTAPRDALISFSAAGNRQGVAFGVHRAMDAFGALLGPIVAVVILSLVPGGYDVVFVVSFLVAVVGMTVLLLFVRNVRTTRGQDPDPAVGRTLAAVKDLWGLKGFRLIAITGAMLGVVGTGDTFILLAVQRRTALDPATFPFLYVAASGVFLLLAVPFGQLADRFGRARVLMVGYGMLAMASLWIALPDAGPWTAVGTIVLLGVFLACTDGVLIALAASVIPNHLRSTGIGLLTTVVGLAKLVSSVFFGAVWSWTTLEIALAVYAAATFLVLLIATRPLAALDR